MCDQHDSLSVSQETSTLADEYLPTLRTDQNIPSCAQVRYRLTRGGMAPLARRHCYDVFLFVEWRNDDSEKWIPLCVLGVCHESRQVAFLSKANFRKDR